MNTRSSQSLPLEPSPAQPGSRRGTTRRRGFVTTAALTFVLGAGGAASAQSHGRAAPAATGLSGTVLGHAFRAQRALAYDYAGNPSSRTIRIVDRVTTCEAVQNSELPAGTVYVDVQIPWRAGAIRSADISVMPGIQGDDSAQGFPGEAQASLDAATHQVGARSHLRLRVAASTLEGVEANQTLTVQGEIEVEDCLGQ